MRALSIRQPWAWAILHAGKRVENRGWPRPPHYMIGQTFLLHASAGCTRREGEDAARWMASKGLVLALVNSSLYGGPGPLIMPAAHTMTRGAIVGRAKLASAVAIGTDTEHAYPVAGPLPTFCAWCGEHVSEPPRTPGGRCPKPDPWAVPGALGLLLADVERLVEPVPFRGALGFFDVPDTLLAGARWEPAHGG